MALTTDIGNSYKVHPLRNVMFMCCTVMHLCIFIKGMSIFLFTALLKNNL